MSHSCSLGLSSVMAFCTILAAANRGYKRKQLLKDRFERMSMICADGTVLSSLLIFTND